VLRLSKFHAGIIIVVVIFICALEDQTEYFGNGHIHICSEIVKFLTTLKSSFFDFTKYFNLRSYKVFRVVSYSTVSTIIKSQLQRILRSFRIASSLKFDTFL
jgi:hypothetical protein